MGQVLAFPLKQQEAEMIESKNIKRRKRYKLIRHRAEGSVNAFNFFGHTVLGTTAGLLLATTPIGFIAVVFGSLLPDIDHPNSTLGRYNPLTAWMKHRGHCHSIVGIALLALPFTYFGTGIYTLAVIGSATHLLGDKFISWLPSKKRFRLKLW